MAAHHAKAAIEEAIEAEVPLIVAVAEHVPLHDILRVSSMTRPTSNGRHVPERHTQCRRVSPDVELRSTRYSRPSLPRGC